MDSGGIREYSGRRRPVGDAEVLEKIALKGVSAEILTGGDWEKGLAYGNHRSAAKYRGEVLRKAATDVALGKASVPGSISKGNCSLTLEHPINVC